MVTDTQPMKRTDKKRSTTPAALPAVQFDRKGKSREDEVKELKEELIPALSKMLDKLKGRLEKLEKK